MSGGSLDCAYCKINDIIDLIEENQLTPLQQAFVRHLGFVKEALHDLEWELSGDYGDDGANEAIREVITPEFELDFLIRKAKAIKRELELFITNKEEI